MFLRYGSGTLPDAECSFTTARKSLENGDGIVQAIEETYTITGTRHGNDPADLTTQLRTLEAIFAKSNPDLSVLLNDGVTRSIHVLRNRNSLDGVRIVKRVHHPNGDGAEYTTYRKWRVVIAARVPTNVRGSDLLSFAEQVEFTSGGPRYDWKTLRNGPPIWPGFEDRDNRVRSYGLPERNCYETVWS